MNLQKLADTLRSLGAPTIYVHRWPWAPPDEKPQGALLTLAEAAEYLGYKPAGLRKLAKAGSVRFVQNGTGPLRFRREWLDEYVASNNASGVKRSPARKRTSKPTNLFPGFDA
jgi:excisionase family DNA binding protein